MSGFMNPLAGGAAAAKGTGPRAMGTGSFSGPFGSGRDPLMRLYGQTDLFDRIKGDTTLTGTQKLLVNAFGGYDQPARRDDMKIHSFENDYNPNTSPSREYVPPEYQGEYKSVLPDWDQPQQMGSPAGFEDPNQYFRGRLRIGQGGVRGVKGATARRRGGAGSARPSRAPTVENQYTDVTQGTGLHT